MNPRLRQMVLDRDETGLERAFFDIELPHFFTVDWREDDADIVAYCAEALELGALAAEWRNDDLFILLDGTALRVRRTIPAECVQRDGDVTACGWACTG